MMTCGIYSELSSMINKSGCDYAYVFLGYGPIYGFIRLYLDVSRIAYRGNEWLMRGRGRVRGRGGREGYREGE